MRIVVLLISFLTLTACGDTLFIPAPPTAHANNGTTLHSAHATAPPR